MRPNYSIDDLNIDIKLLELRHRQEWGDLKDQIQLTKESLKPMRLIKKGLGEINIKSADSKDLFSTLLSIGLGYVSSKAVVGTPKNPVKRFLGSMLQLAITSFITKKATENK